MYITISSNNSANISSPKRKRINPVKRTQASGAKTIIVANDVAKNNSHAVNPSGTAENSDVVNSTNIISYAAVTQNNLSIMKSPGTGPNVATNPDVPASSSQNKVNKEVISNEG